ncbi:agmatine deiminase family protein [Sinimarinibacterium sp. CAU 1509]|uniref:agmatine deiminase family protein n=1 Tax=Sinimarinibacterium sp. CAU 1509 TaxID=2562283 RepID=UPI0010AC55CC|nr:agmatine deiminase family protein [Sinimarinibacterium sp. CAU 1509]TJY56789.1 agmatine deiminase family protein [Sinimarinibacterium sp. CAU 1509]
MTIVLPAEWAPQRAVQLTWPRPDGDFADIFAEVEANFTQIAVAITRFENLIVACGEDVDGLREHLTAAGAQAERLQLYPVPADDVWARDHGPITVFRDGDAVHLDFVFNGWGGKFDATLDNQVTRALAAQQCWNAPVESLDFVLEGGGIESDGQGTLLTTERCLLAPTRNPQFDKAQIEARLQQWFGLQRILWLRHGDLLGDDTDGHIDTVARFCDARTIAYQACDDASDPHYADLGAMAEELRALRTADGKPYRLVPLPLPQPIHADDGRRLPAGYANFLILNGAVLVPIYADINDEEALSRLRPCFPDRKVIGIDCRALIAQYGSLHCVTMQIPSAAA